MVELVVATPGGGVELSMTGEAGKKLEAGGELLVLMIAGAPGQAAARKQTPGLTEGGEMVHYRRGAGRVWASLAGNLTPAPVQSLSPVVGGSPRMQRATL